MLALRAAIFALLLVAEPALAKSKGTSPTEQVIGLVVILVFGLITWAAIDAGQQRLNDPNDDGVIYLEQLSQVAKLSGAGVWHVVIIRQSGNVERQFQVQGTGQDALRQATSTFRRAKMPAVFVQENEAGVLRFSRMFHDHRGSAEGKKVGKIEIRRAS